MKPLKISLIMANYNNAAYIEEAINSALKQTHENWELIIIDDASRDCSVEIIKPFLKDKRIKLIRHEKNLGCGFTKKEAADLAKGEIVGIFDADDALHPDALGEVVSAYEKNLEYDMVYTNHYWCDKDLKPKGTNEWEGQTDPAKTNLLEIKVHHFLTFKKVIYNKVGGFDKDYLIAEDKDLIYRIEEIGNLHYIDKPLYYYRCYKNGVSQRNKHKTKNWVIKAMHKAYKRRLGGKLPNFNIDEMADLLYEGALRSFILTDAKEFKYFFNEAYKLNKNFSKLIKVGVSKLIKEKNIK